MPCHALSALRRHSSIHSGSRFFSEMALTTSSFNPGGNVSASIRVSKPYLYSWVASCSMVSVAVLIDLPRIGLDGPLSGSAKNAQARQYTTIAVGFATRSVPAAIRDRPEDLLQAIS